jgi:type III restriction enzyme
MPPKIDQLIINSPYEEPKKYWKYNRETKEFILEEGRRSAGYIRASNESKSFDDPGIFVEIPLVNKIRLRVKRWRESGYPGATGITRKLLEYWHDSEEREYPFFFCQIDAIETLIWLVEAPASEKTGIEIPSDGGEFQRLCTKMATGTGKTVVMAMLIAWHILNKVTYPQDTRFSKNVFIVTPGLTIKNRLQVLIPSKEGNYYDEFNVVPPSLRDKLRGGRVFIRNWHAMLPEDKNKGPKVVKKGPESDEAFTRRVLGNMENAKNIVAINDEGHHAWRIPAESKIKSITKDEIEESTVWVSGLDRIHKTKGILKCFDFSATPFVPTGKKSTDEMLFTWIVSDFGLNDAIESGLVKTPRVVIRDDGRLAPDYKSRFYHIYMDPEVKENLNRKTRQEDPLPSLVIDAFYFLGKDWLETYEKWQEKRQQLPPVMITVCNRVETAARVHYAFIHGKIMIDELNNQDKILHIDSKVLKEAESKEETEELSSINKISKKEKGELLRRMVDTVGKIGEIGEQIQTVISVGMLSEGWDAKTVTQILGLRAFTSQLLCEQVVGRGLRRTSYEVNPETGLFEPEYVNIFGIPFTFLPHESKDGPPPPPSPPKTRVEPLKEKTKYEIKWPNVIRIDHTYTPRLTLDIDKVKTLNLDASKTATLAELAPIVDGKPDATKISSIDLMELGKRFRLQKIIFETARDVFDQMKPNWSGNKDTLLAQLIRIVEKFMKSNKIRFDSLFAYDDLRRRILLTLNMNKIVQHIFEAIRFENTEEIKPILDVEKPIRSTGDMKPWYTGKPCEITQHSHISHVVFDSTWEASEAYELDRNENVDAWVKNDHLGFEIIYIYKGIIKKYRPDFIIRLKNRKNLILEVKGKDTQRDRTKREFLKEWVDAANKHGGFGEWYWDVSFDISDLKGIIEKNL